MSFEIKIIADSISEYGNRITTFQLRYPRFIHAEFMTHRLFSRNASSSRAIPVERMIADLRRDPGMPVYWGSNKPGMQAGAELTEHEISVCKQIWLNSMENAIHSATQLVELGLHKQIANRILEPWGHINVVVTATDWENYFTLRCHKDAQPEIKMLADLMREQLRIITPHELQSGEWHLPYVNAEERQTDFAKKISVARCARVSYLTHDGRQTTISEDLTLYDRLVGSQPLHASPAEHQATPDRYIETEGSKPLWWNKEKHGNFTGWIQFRKTLPNEFVEG